ncbi:MAG: signal recognition particle-docking protein FtsY, partial [Candidatus Altiarchaeota archaeon]
DIGPYEGGHNITDSSSSKSEDRESSQSEILVDSKIEESFIPSRDAVEATKPASFVKPKLKLSASTALKSLLSSKVSLSEADLEEILWDLNLDLMASDIEMETAQAILTELKKKLIGEDIPKDKLTESIKSRLRDVLLSVMRIEKSIDLLSVVENGDKPVLILFLGINGTGKTTTIAKVAHLLKGKGYGVVLAAGDTYRAGAIEQITELGSRLGVKVISSEKGADSAAVIFDAVEHAKAKKIDVVLADSAGRMQTNTNLMEELRKVVRVNKPDLKIFIGDSLTGADASEQAKTFHEAVGIDAVILSKMDADSKGGSAISICHAIKKPIIYAGIGQQLDDLKKFDVEWFVDQLI